MELVVGFLTLVVLEIILGIDNVVILSILVCKIKDLKKRNFAKYVGLTIAVVLRILCLYFLTWMISFNNTLFTVMNIAITPYKLVFLLGGLFLLYKSTVEIDSLIRNKIGEKEGSSNEEIACSTNSEPVLRVILEIGVLDFVFALDSIITAIALTNHIYSMIGANVIAVFLMLVLINVISNFFDKNPTYKILGLSFVFLIGTSLVSKSFGYDIPRGYLYFAIGFSLLVETINTVIRNRNKK